MNTNSPFRESSCRSRWLAPAFLCAAIGLFSAHAAEAGKYALKPFASGFTSPLALVSHGSKPDHLLVADQPGVIYVVNPDGTTQPTPFLDVRGKLVKVGPNFDERGLLSLALHPNFNSNGKFYVVYNAPLRAGVPTNWNSTLRLSEFHVSKSNPLQADLASEKVILEIDKPAFNHNGGCLGFGPDAYLYMSVGDGGDGNDVGLGHAPEGNGQNKDTLLAKILRIDINKPGKDKAYSIPWDNPFAKGGGRPEIYAWGVRNPWRMSFDKGGEHQLFEADVGQTMFEEVNIIEKGRNYGWRIREGFVCFDPKDDHHPPADCPKVAADGTPLTDPIFAYKNANGFRNDPEALGISITGGFVYRGKALPELNGRYVFGDWSSNFALPMGTVLVGTPPEQNGTSKWTVGPLPLADVDAKGHIKAFIVSVGQDAEGEIYFLTNGNSQVNGTSGRVWKLVRAQ
ncbi:MAG TPA: PQQ-dependent sugar dehydrogenase [Verrucomicrobiae bacterium]|nr:PQQ-dependent sugar dehydrogenase [Verrucomicrobiae bacterium]